MQSRRKFSKEFKEETVKLANQSGITLKQLGAELGLSPNMFSRWRRELSQSGRCVCNFLRQLNNKLKGNQLTKNYKGPWRGLDHNSAQAYKT